MTGRTIYQTDVDVAFLNSPLPYPVFVRCPEGFEIPGKVWRLKRALYGLKEAPRAWNTTLVKFLKDNGFEQCLCDPCIFIHRPTDLWVVFVVDDILYAPMSGRDADADWFRELLNREYGIKDLGKADVFVGIKIERDPLTGEMKLSQRAYIEKILKRFRWEHSNPASTPVASGVKLSKDHCPSTPEEKEWSASMQAVYRQAVGTLLYLAVTTRPDISYAVKEVAMYCHNPGRKHWTAVKRIFRYLKGTKDHGIIFKPGDVNHLSVLGYADASHADLDNGKSTGGFALYLGGNLVSWRSRNQTLVALSTCEAEYIALNECARDLVFVRQLADFFRLPVQRAKLITDNRGAGSVSYNEEVKQRTRHILVRYHFVRDLVLKGQLCVHWIASSENTADIFTKGLDEAQHAHLRMKLLNNPVFDDEGTPMVPDEPHDKVLMAPDQSHSANTDSHAAECALCCFLRYGSVC
ncbi:unnamed protein product [Vitrella brassicaformis CCMP3155]|uniref:Reverse transcriptase Ty1/copia-type domain-containing protein n=1 Tax=Vitrella brassicaformis (strain CCMP3155) TaxID=1169540 RepID=A0A0G4EPT6_VITBC|nr:unnamed protein product [Vitrella brassicaformis CCMP3155]|eukprot:CEL99583.1 unnamed protein product [Vitrella brassicaformis CCMP3155]